MFVVLLSYKVDPAVIERLRPAHIDWLKAGIAEGRLLVAGRKNPVTGGMLIARGPDRAEIEAWVATDPFLTEGAADAEIIEIGVTFCAPEFESMKG